MSATRARSSGWVAPSNASRCWRRRSRPPARQPRRRMAGGARPRRPAAPSTRSSRRPTDLRGEATMPRTVASPFPRAGRGALGQRLVLDAPLDGVVRLVAHPCATAPTARAVRAGSRSGRARCAPASPSAGCRPSRRRRPAGRCRGELLDCSGRPRSAASPPARGSGSEPSVPNTSSARDPMAMPTGGDHHVERRLVRRHHPEQDQQADARPQHPAPLLRQPGRRRDDEGHRRGDQRRGRNDDDVSSTTRSVSGSIPAMIPRSARNSVSSCMASVAPTPANSSVRTRR